MIYGSTQINSIGDVLASHLTHLASTAGKRHENVGRWQMSAHNKDLAEGAAIEADTADRKLIDAVRVLARFAADAGCDMDALTDGTIRVLDDAS